MLTDNSQVSLMTWRESARIFLQASFSTLSIVLYGVELNMVTHKTELKLRTPEIFRSQRMV